MFIMILPIQEAFIQNALGQTNSAIATSSDKKPLPNVKDKSLIHTEENPKYLASTYSAKDEY